MSQTITAGTSQTMTTSTYITRTNQKADTVYVDVRNGEAFVSPDGVGRFFYDTLLEALEEHGHDLPRVHLRRGWDD